MVGGQTGAPADDDHVPWSHLSLSPSGEATVLVTAWTSPGRAGPIPGAGALPSGGDGVVLPN